MIRRKDRRRRPWIEKSGSYVFKRLNGTDIVAVFCRVHERTG